MYRIATSGDLELLTLRIDQRIKHILSVGRLTIATVDGDQPVRLIEPITKLEPGEIDWFLCAMSTAKYAPICEFL